MWFTWNCWRNIWMNSVNYMMGVLFQCYLCCRTLIVRVLHVFSCPSKLVDLQILIWHKRCLVEIGHNWRLWYCRSPWNYVEFHCSGTVIWSLFHPYFEANMAQHIILTISVLPCDKLWRWKLIWFLLSAWDWITMTFWIIAACWKGRFSWNR
jgi:hypothetical protein